jgi:hypothetical protein
MDLHTCVKKRKKTADPVCYLLDTRDPIQGMKRNSCQGGEKMVVSQCKGVAILQVTVKTLIKQVNCDLRGGA